MSIKIGVFGAGRGLGFVDILSRHPDAQMVAVCDKSDVALINIKNLMASIGKNIEIYTDFDEFLNHDMDAIILANCAFEHTPYAIKALKSGRHVLSELLAVQNLSEAVALVEAVEESGKIYAYAENCCYFRSTMEMKKLYRSGELGEFQHGEGEYVHDCESIWHLITYGDRNHWRNWIPATFYCTHASGPLMNITGLRPLNVVAFDTPNLFGKDYGRRGGDGSLIVCQMSNGGTAKFLQGWYRREPQSLWHSLYATNGMVESDRFGDTVNRINYYNHGNKELKSYIPTFSFESELSRTVESHGGADFYTLDFFIGAIADRYGKDEIIDVYEALDMTLVGTIGYRSIWEGNIPLEIPDFRKKEVRDKYRNDTFCCDPRLTGVNQPSSSSFGEINIPDEVYEKIKKQYADAVSGLK